MNPSNGGGVDSRDGNSHADPGIAFRYSDRMPPPSVPFFRGTGAAIRQVARGEVYCYDAFFLGTFAPFFRASERPIAIACFRLFTVPPFPPGPDFSVPLFFRCIAFFTLLPAAFPYFRLLPL